MHSHFFKARTLNTNTDWFTGNGAVIRRWRWQIPSNFIRMARNDMAFYWAGNNVNDVANSFFEHLTYSHLLKIRPSMARFAQAPELPTTDSVWPELLEILFSELSIVHM